MSFRLPSTKDLRAFETAARLGSIKAAADFLAITPSALSRRIQSLEDELGQPLFQRDPRGLTLTESGRQYADRLQAIFQSLAEATDAARAEMPQRLRLLAPGLYAHYLLPGLKIFETRHPGMQISLDIFPGALGTDPRVEEADLVILYGAGRWDGWETLFLSPHAYSMPVCAPGYLPNGPVDDPHELAQYTWIRSPHFFHVWENWCSAVGYPGLQPKRWFEADSGLTGRELARNGMGIWMGGGLPHRPLDPVIANELVLAHSFHAFMFNYGFYLAWRPQAMNNPAAVAYCEWVRGMLAAAENYYRGKGFSCSASG